MISLRLVLDRLLDARPSGARRTSSNLARHLLDRAPAGCEVEAILPKTTAEAVDLLRDEVPGLVEITQAPFKAELLAKSWQHGVLTGSVGGGFIHAMGLFAPIRDISLAYGIDQTVVTVNDASAFTRPELHDPAEVKWREAMLRRAHRYASGIVAPTNAVADQLTECYDFGDRLRVIGGAADPAIRLPDSEEEGDWLAASMSLPEQYVLTMATAAPRKGLEPLLRAFARPELRELRLVVLGPSEVAGRTTEALVHEAGLDAGRVVVTGVVSDAHVAVALQRASALVVPSLEAGFGLPMVEAFRFGTPVVHSDAPALREIGMDAARCVARDDAAGYPERLAAAIAEVVGDTELGRKLRIAGRDRSPVHRWEIAADQVWAMHADL